MKKIILWLHGRKKSWMKWGISQTLIQHKCGELVETAFVAKFTEKPIFYWIEIILICQEFIIVFDLIWMWVREKNEITEKWENVRLVFMRSKRIIMLQHTHICEHTQRMTENRDQKWRKCNFKNGKNENAWRRIQLHSVCRWNLKDYSGFLLQPCIFMHGVRLANIVHISIRYKFVSRVILPNVAMSMWFNLGKSVAARLMESILQLPMHYISHSQRRQPFNRNMSSRSNDVIEV